MLRSPVINTKEEYFEWLEKIEFYKRYHKSCFEPPDQFPSIVLLEEEYNHRYGRNYMIQESVYLGEFGPICQYQCEADQYKECRYCGKDMWDDYIPGDTLS